MDTKSAYNCLVNTAENLRQTLFVRNPMRYYFNYALYLATAQGPKLSYVDQFEPEYTRKTVRYNAPIVASMFIATLILSEYVRRSRNCKKTDL